jgi:hypothetical protein
MNDEERKLAHPPLLIGSKSLLERLPGIGLLLEVCCSLGQRFCASVHELDRIAVAQRFDRIARAWPTVPSMLAMRARRLSSRARMALSIGGQYFSCSGVNCSAALIRLNRAFVKAPMSAVLNRSGPPAEGA